MGWVAVRDRDALPFYGKCRREVPSGQAHGLCPSMVCKTLRGSAVNHCFNFVWPSFTCLALCPSGVLGYLRPVAVILVSSAHVFTAACCWHIHGLVFRPHGGVSYNEIFPSPRMEAQLDLTPVPQADDYLPPGPPPRVEAVPLQSQLARPLHSDIPQPQTDANLRSAQPQLSTSALDSADLAGDTCAAPQTEAPEVCTADAQVPNNESNAAPAEAVRGEAPEAESGFEVCNIEVLIRLPSGRRLRSSFLSTDPISKLYDAVEEESGREPEIRAGLHYWLIQAHPREVYSDKSMTVGQAGLQNLTVLNVELQR